MKGHHIKVYSDLVVFQRTRIINTFIINYMLINIPKIYDIFFCRLTQTYVHIFLGKIFLDLKFEKL